MVYLYFGMYGQKVVKSALIVLSFGSLDNIKFNDIFVDLFIKI